MHVHIVLCFGEKRVLFTNKLSECWCYISNPYLFTKFRASHHFGKRVTQRCIHIVLCCGVKTVLFTNKLSECWCHIINLHTSKHLCKRVTQTCMFTLFFVMVRKGYCLPTSYQNVGVVSVIPTCLQSFMYPSILVRELHKDAYSHCCLLWCEKSIVYQQVIRMMVSYHFVPVYKVSYTQAFW